MRMEKIGDNKIKVTISLDDLEERDIDLDSLNYNSPAAQELFWDMMEQAEIEFGFTASDSQLCIEATPDSEEGFIITITKLDEDGDFESIQKFIKNRYKRHELKIKRKTTKICSTLIIYSFENFDDLTDLSKKIHWMYNGDSTLYRYKQIYYLVLTRNDVLSENEKLFEVLLNEYGRKISNIAFFEGYLNEYATKLIEHNALDIVNSYF